MISCERISGAAIMRIASHGSWRASVMTFLTIMLSACATPQPNTSRVGRTAAPAATVPSTPSAVKAPPPRRPSSAGSTNGPAQSKVPQHASLARKPTDGLAPGEVGYYMDVLHGRLRQIGNSQFGLAHEGSRIVVTLIGNGSDGTPIEPSLPSQLTTLAKVLAEYTKTLVSVQAEAGGDSGKSRRCAALAARKLNSGGVVAKHIAVVGVDTPPSSLVDGDFSACRTVVVQLEPLLRSD